MTRATDTPGIVAAQNQTSAAIAAMVSQNMMVACSLTPMYWIAKNSSAHAIAHTVVVSFPGFSGLIRKAT